MRARTHSGFTLIELSIVLVIIGLLVGGVLVGRDLIKAATLKTVISEQTQYKTALNTFRLKYNGLPGDLASATTFWGKSAADCNSDPGTAATPGTCNGNGDGRIMAAEGYRAWQQLALAALVPGEYLGKLDGSGNRVIGLVLPRSKYETGGWFVTFMDTAIFGRANSHLLEISGAPNGINWDNGAIFTGMDAQTIDQKSDNGLPDSGNVFFLKGDTTSGAHPDCVANPFSAASAGAVNLTSTEFACRIYFWIN
jgi:prepilin-type N-terminal cleavage/methylation domain-containing protein